MGKFQVRIIVVLGLFLMHTGCNDRPGVERLNLEEAPGTPTPTPVPTATPRPFAFGYVGSQYADQIYSYTLNRLTGEVLPTSNASIASQSLPISTAVSADHRYLYAANYASNSISAYTIDPASGDLSLIGHFALPPSSAPGWITSHPTRPILYVANAGTSKIAILDIASDGTLSLRSLTAAGAGVTSLAIHPSGAALFSADQNADQISTFAIDSAGDLSAIAVSPLATGSQPNQLEISRSGRAIYVADWGTGKISQFSVSGTTLTSIGADVDAGGGGVYTVNVSPDGEHVFALKPYGNGISAHRVRADGSLAAGQVFTKTGAVGLSFFSNFAFLTSWTSSAAGLPIEARAYSSSTGLSATGTASSTSRKGQYQMTIVE